MHFKTTDLLFFFMISNFESDLATIVGTGKQAFIGKFQILDPCITMTRLGTFVKNMRISSKLSCLPKFSSYA